ncbi:MAG: helicase HerA domain-containing protein [bacterium]
MAKKREIDLGIIIGGSLAEGLGMKLNPEYSVEDLRAGEFAVIQGTKTQFFSMITDIQLNNSNEQIVANPPDNDLIREILAGNTTYTTATLRPMLMISEDDPDGTPKPVKTIPTHFAKVYKASEEDVQRIFHKEDGVKYFNIGNPIDMDVSVCIDLKRFIERSNGIFGKTGTGKSFTTRIFLCGIIRSGIATTLIFDMHSEYGWRFQTESGESKGLKQLFGSQVVIFTLDPASADARDVKYDEVVEIPYEEITIDDLILLQQQLNLSSTAAESAHILIESLGEHWLERFLNMNAEQLYDHCRSHNLHSGAISALQRKLNMLRRLSFFKPRSRVTRNAVKSILDYLDAGKHVVLEFGRHKDLLSYMLVASILTRQIREEYERKTEEALGKRVEIKPLIITIEEAHKFLDPSIANQTIFGTIAREMRKYNVTLLIVDQRPSQIDPEVLSQLGTRITALLNDEKDIDAIFTGVGGREALRAVLASLDEKQQVLIIGYAVPMPVVVQMRNYDALFWRDLGVTRDVILQRAEEEKILF